MEGASSRWTANILLLSAFPESGGFSRCKVDPVDAHCLAEGAAVPPFRLLIPCPPTWKPRSEPSLPAPRAAAPRGHGEAGPTAPPRPLQANFPASPGIPGAAQHPECSPPARKPPSPDPVHRTREMRRSGQAGERPGCGDEPRPPGLGRETPRDLCFLLCKPGLGSLASLQASETQGVGNSIAGSVLRQCPPPAPMG